MLLSVKFTHLFGSGYDYQEATFYNVLYQEDTSAQSVLHYTYVFTWDMSLTNVVIAIISIILLKQMGFSSAGCKGT